MSESKNILYITSDFSELKNIRDFVEKKSRDFGVSTEIKDKMVLAVDEACTNIIKHSFKEDSSKELAIEVGKDNEKLIVSIYDNGKPFNPNNVNSPDMDNYFRKFKKSGLGIYLIKALIDEIEYIPSDMENTKNTLKLVKKIS